MATKIYIDQGHNPVNPNAGAEGSGYREQDIVFPIGIELSEILRARGYETRLSRPGEGSQLGTSNITSLSARVNDANSWGADYFISLHTNASSSPDAGGTEALVYSLGTSAAELGGEIAESISEATGFRNRGVVARPGLYVLRKTAMPAVLMELGFITNQREADLMASEPRLFAEAIADGIDGFFSVTASEPLDGKAEFLRDNPASGSLKIQAYKARMALPVPGVEVVIYKDFPEGEHIFFSGVTDENGMIDGIELPAPPRSNSLSFGAPDKLALYDLKATHPSYAEIRRPVEIYDGIKSIQPLMMTLAAGGDGQ